MHKNAVKAEVEAFRKDTAHGTKTEDCFPAWYLHYTFGISKTQSIAQSADPAENGGSKGYDYGMDAFHLDTRREERPTLIIVQAKYSDSLSYITRGFRDLERALPKLAALMEGKISEDLQENRIIVNFRAALNRLAPCANMRWYNSLQQLIV